MYLGRIKGWNRTIRRADEEGNLGAPEEYAFGVFLYKLLDYREKLSPRVVDYFAEAEFIVNY